MLHLLAGGYGRECRNILLITELPLFVINASSLAARVTKKIIVIDYLIDYDFTPR